MADYTYIKLSAADQARLEQQTEHDPVARPAHYLQHPSGMECRKIAEAFSYNVGTAIAYLWRHQYKHESPIEDLRKAITHLTFEVERLEGEK
jgi:hypothetical protein